MSTPHPEIRRVSYADHIKAATDAGRKDDPDRAARLLGAATQLTPLHAIQVSLDSLARTAQGYNEGKPDPYGHPLSYHTAEALKHVEYHRDVLKAGYDAAEAMIADMKSQTASLEKTMSQQKKDADDHPQLTTSGEPHPLEEGGYDANADPALPGNISDVEALKEGKQTHAQAEAIGAADAADDDGHEPAGADGLDRPDDDALKAAPKAAPAPKASAPATGKHEPPKSTKK